MPAASRPPMPDTTPAPSKNGSATATSQHTTRYTHHRLAWRLGPSIAATANLCSSLGSPCGAWLTGCGRRQLALLALPPCVAVQDAITPRRRSELIALPFPGDQTVKPQTHI